MKVENYPFPGLEQTGFYPIRFVDQDGHPVKEGSDDGMWRSVERPTIGDYLFVGIRRRTCPAFIAYVRSTWLTWFLPIGRPCELAVEVGDV